jgi:hypothetical protein
MRSGVLTAGTMKSTVFWNAMSRGLVGFIDVSDECSVSNKHCLLFACTVYLSNVKSVAVVLLKCRQTVHQSTQSIPNTSTLQGGKQVRAYNGCLFVYFAILSQLMQSLIRY